MTRSPASPPPSPTTSWPTTSGAAEWTAGRETSERIEARTDELAAPPYDTLTADELDELIAGLEPIAAAAQAVDD